MNLIVNSLPSKTWNRLGMNDAKVEIEGEFTNKAPVLKNEVPNVTFRKIEPSDSLFLKRPLEETTANSDIYEISLAENEKSASPVVLTFSYEDGEKAASRLIIRSKKGSSLDLLLFLKDEGTSVSSIETEIYAEEESKVNLFAAEILGKDSLSLTGILGNADKKAEINLTRLELGGKKIYSDVNIDLVGEESAFNTCIGYHAKKDQLIDMNYVSNHIGKNTTCLMEASGTLEEKAKKVFRGSIDFKRGCKGARGTESESVILLGDDLVNQTIPLILCAEEDVEGNHGASIGRLDDKILFYLGAKGIPEEEAQKIIALSRINAICSLMPDEEIREEIEKFEEERGISYVPEL